MTIEIKGKTYTAKTLPDGGISLFLMQKAIKSDERLGLARKAWEDDFDNMEKESAYKKAWRDHCELLLGDVTGLSIDELHPVEVDKLNDFFVGLVVTEIEKSKELRETLEDSSQKEESPDSQKDTKSKS